MPLQFWHGFAGVGVKKTTLFICEHSTFALQFLRHNTFIDHSLDPYHEYHCYFSQA